jgi:SsrA-binding protein
MSKSLSIQNRRARADYFIDDEIEAGLILKGTEVKSLREGKANIQDAFAAPKEGGLWLMNSYIAEYEGGNRFNHESRRPRQLLLHKREISKLLGKVKAKGYTIVPLTMYFNARGIAKVLIGLARGKREFEKRDTIKTREWNREKQRIMKNNQ